MRRIAHNGANTLLAPTSVPGTRVWRDGLIEASKKKGARPADVCVPFSLSRLTRSLDAPRANGEIHAEVFPAEEVKQRYGARTTPCHAGELLRMQLHSRVRCGFGGEKGESPTPATYLVTLLSKTSPIVCTSYH